MSRYLGADGGSLEALTGDIMALVRTGLVFPRSLVLLGLHVMISS